MTGRWCGCRLHRRGGSASMRVGWGIQGLHGLHVAPAVAFAPALHRRHSIPPCLLHQADLSAEGAPARLSELKATGRSQPQL